MDSMSDIIEIVQKKIDKTEQVFYSNKKEHLFLERRRLHIWKKMKD